MERPRTKELDRMARKQGKDMVPRPRKIAPWRKDERYFKRYRDTQKAIPLRPRLKDNEGG